MSYNAFSGHPFCGSTHKAMYKAGAYHCLKYHQNKKVLLGEVAKECSLLVNQNKLSKAFSIKIQLPLFWDKHSVVKDP